MQIAIDPRFNRVRINGHSIAGHGTWEAASLAVLLHYAKRDPGRDVTAGLLDQHLAEVGQKTPLTRTAWRRLWNGLEAMFVEAGCGEQFHQRFVCRPRGRTVGPWRWQIEADDQLAELDWPDNEAATSAYNRLHSVAADGTVASTLVVARKLATVHSLWLHASRFAAISELVTGEEWNLAALPIQMHRAVTLADAYTMTDQFGLAREQLKWALDLAERHPVCRDQRTYAEFILIATEDAEVTGIKGSVPLAHRLLAYLGDRTASGQEVDTRGRAWMYLHMASSYVDAPGESAAKAGEAYTSNDFVSAALCHAIIGWHSDLVAMSIEYFSRNIGASSKSLGMPELNEFIDGYIAAREWRKVLDIPESFEVARFWLAWMIVKHPNILNIVADRIKKGQWLGPNPDSIEFMTETLMRGIETGDPRYGSRASAAYYKYAKQKGIKKNLELAEETFLKICRNYPGVSAFLRDVGVMSEVPDLENRI